MLLAFEDAPTVQRCRLRTVGTTQILIVGVVLIEDPGHAQQVSLLPGHSERHLLTHVIKT